jgi:predicted amidohydrolase YtcJ
MCTRKAHKAVPVQRSARRRTGSGKVADMVILSDNPYTVNNDKIRDIKVEQLILAGKPYESAVTALGRTIWNGIFTRNKY